MIRVDSVEERDADLVDTPVLGGVLVVLLDVVNLEEAGLGTIVDLVHVAA